MTCFAPTLVSPSATAQDPTKHVNYVLGMVLGVDDLTQEFGYLSQRDQWIDPEHAAERASAEDVHARIGVARDVDAQRRLGVRRLHERRFRATDPHLRNLSRRVASAAATAN